MDIVHLFISTSAGKWLYEVWTEDITSIVSSKVPVVGRLSYETIIVNHVLQTVAFIVRIQSRSQPLPPIWLTFHQQQ